MPIIIKQIQTTQRRSCRETETVWPAETCKYKLTHGTMRDTDTGPDCIMRLLLVRMMEFQRLMGVWWRTGILKMKKRNNLQTNPSEENKNYKIQMYLKKNIYFFHLHIYMLNQNTLQLFIRYWHTSATLEQLILCLMHFNCVEVVLKSYYWYTEVYLIVLKWTIASILVHFKFLAFKDRYYTENMQSLLIVLLKPI